MVTLDRGMGLLQATATNIIGMVGVGPFLTIPFMVSAMGGPHIIYAWAFGAVLALCDGLVYAELGASMLFIRNQDKPGFIGNLGRTLSENGVNIATFHLGRTAPGKDAIALIQVDQPLTDPVIDQVCAIPNVIRTKALRF